MNRMENILLVYPEVPNNTYWSFKYALRLIGKKSTMPPLGLITIAAYIQSPCHLKLVDMNIQSLKDEDIIKADAVFISAMIVQKESFAKVVSRCNQLGKTVVAGGPYPTSSYREISGVDHFVLGESEDILDMLIDDLKSGKAKHIYRSMNRPNIVNRPVPRFDLLSINEYASMSIQYSRGCPYKCEFCDIWITLGNKPRLKSSGQICSELDTLFGLGWRGPVFIVDDNFIGNKMRVKKELLPVMIRWQKSHGYAFRFYTEASINLADDDDLLLGMRNAGFNEVFIGIETPSDSSLKETGKIQNLRINMLDAVRKIQIHGMEVTAGFIIGFDSDEKDIFERQFKFIQMAAIPKAMVGLLTALPGTKLYDRLKSEGRLRNQSDGNNTHSVTTNFETSMDPVELQKGYQSILARIYGMNLKNYFLRCDTLLNNIGAVKYFQRNIRLYEIKILIKSIFFQSFTRYGYYYLKFILRNLLVKRAVFSEAVRMAIQGHHFYLITREMLKVEGVIQALDEKVTRILCQMEDYKIQITGHSKDSFQYFQMIWNQKKQIINDAKTALDDIHVDFRADLAKRIKAASHRLKASFKEFEVQFREYSITD